MTTEYSPVTLASKLIACHSTTPATGEVFDVLEAMLGPLGFETSRFVAGDDSSDVELGGAVENLFAIRKGTSGKHFAFAGHLDVVPPGDGWASDPFEPEIRGDLLYGRGAVDMKGSIASFVPALNELPENPGTISLIITGDEEGPARLGTVATMDVMKERGSGAGPLPCR